VIWLGVAAVVGFLCGSIPFGVVLAKLRGVDLRKVGSGNIGATNAARALGKGTGVLVLLLDAGKAFGPLIAVRYLALSADVHWVEAVLGFFAVAGHIFSPWLGGKGGKGVATGFGVFLALDPRVAGGAGAVWLLLYVVTRVSSIGSLVSITAVPPALWLTGAPLPWVVLGLALWPLILLRHKDNIRRLLRREESKV
jgi:glycerol-3-phosphate acyltransferase PlsY